MKQGWEIKKLGEVSEILNGGTPKTNIAEYWDGEIHWITPADLGKLKKPTVDDTPRMITRLGLEKSSAKLFPKNSVILSTRAPIGHLAINEVPMSTNQGCRGIVPSKKLDTWFLYYFLKKNVELLDSLGTGATFKELSTKALAGVEIPLPPLPEQQRIVSILDEAFAAIAKAKANAEQNLKNAKELFESYLNSIEADKVDLGSLVDIKTGKLNSNAAVENGKYPFFTCSREVYAIDNYAFDDEAILLAGNNASGDFNVKHYKGKFNAYQRTYVITVNEKQKVLYRYLYFQLLKSLKEFKEMSVGANTRFLKLGMIQGLKIALPTIDEQQTIVRQLDALRAETQKLEALYQKKIADLEELKKSILQKAFAGELRSPEGAEYKSEVATPLADKKPNTITSPEGV